MTQKVSRHIFIGGRYGCSGGLDAFRVFISNYQVKDNTVLLFRTAVIEDHDNNTGRGSNPNCKKSSGDPFFCVSIQRQATCSVSSEFSELDDE